jgi:protein TonB
VIMSSAQLKMPVGHFDIATQAVERPSPVQAVVAPRAAYASPRIDPVAAAIALAVAAAAFTGLQYLDIVSVHKHEHRMAVVNVMDLAPPPPPKAPPEQKKGPTPHIQSPIVAPPPLVATPAPPQTVAVADAPAPPQPEPVAPHVAIKVADPAPAPPSAAPADGGDLSSKMISATPPSYPEDSRRLHEQGTVVLAVLLALDGKVDRVAVAKSSGFYRLDRAASGAVRHWRWSPTVRNGQPVFVQGNVVIPFVLHG